MKENSKLFKALGFYRVGEHMSIRIVPALKHRVLPGGETIPKNARVGMIDIVRHIKKESTDVKESRRLLAAFVKDLLCLIDQINDGTIPTNVVLFQGISHLGGMRMLENLGFQKEKANLYARLEGAVVGIVESQQYSLNSFRKKWNQTTKVMITRETLLRNEDLYKEFYKKLLH